MRSLPVQTELNFLPNEGAQAGGQRSTGLETIKTNQQITMCNDFGMRNSSHKNWMLKRSTSSSCLITKQKARWTQWESCESDITCLEGGKSWEMRFNPELSEMYLLFCSRSSPEQEAFVSEIYRQSSNSHSCWHVELWCCPWSAWMNFRKKWKWYKINVFLNISKLLCAIQESSMTQGPYCKTIKAEVNTHMDELNADRELWWICYQKAVIQDFISLYPRIRE